MTTSELEIKLSELWGSPVKPFNVNQANRITNHIDLNSLTNENLIYLLDVLLKSSSSSMYGFSVDHDNYDILWLIKDKLYSVKSISRRLNPILRCYDIIFNQSHEKPGTFALATIYLVAEFESYLKANNRYLDKNGIIKKELPRKLKSKLYSPQYKIGKRINQIGDVIKIYCFRNNSNFSIYLKNFDKETKSYNKKKLKGLYSGNIDGKKIKAKYSHMKIIERVNKTRNLLMHGDESFLNTELFFYASLHAILFLNNPTLYDEY